MGRKPSKLYGMISKNSKNVRCGPIFAHSRLKKLKFIMQPLPHNLSLCVCVRLKQSNALFNNPNKKSV